METFLPASRVGSVGEPTASLDLDGMSLDMVRGTHERVAVANAHAPIGRAP
jgi:hypothetical protein